MADAVVASPGTSADVVVRSILDEGTIDVANNRSYLTADVYLKVTASNGAGGPWKSSPPSSASLSSSAGVSGSWSGPYDLRPASSLPSLHLIHWEGWITHDADGRKTVTVSFSFSGAGGTPLGGGSGTDAITLTPIDRNLVRVKVDDEMDLHQIYLKRNGAMVAVQPRVKVDGVMTLLDNA